MEIEVIGRRVIAGESDRASEWSRVESDGADGGFAKTGRGIRIAADPPVGAVAVEEKFEGDGEAVFGPLGLGRERKRVCGGGGGRTK